MKPGPTILVSHVSLNAKHAYLLTIRHVHMGIVNSCTIMTLIQLLASSAHLYVKNA